MSDDDKAAGADGGVAEQQWVGERWPPALEAKLHKYGHDFLATDPGKTLPDVQEEVLAAWQGTGIDQEAWLDGELLAVRHYMLTYKMPARMVRAAVAKRPERCQRC